MASVLLVAPVPIAGQRAGPAIRYWELARVLSAHRPVTLLVPNDDHPAHPDFTVCSGAEADLASLLAEHAVVVVQGPALQQHPRLAQALHAGEHCLVADLYDPITTEQLAIDRGGERGRWLHKEYSSLLNEQLRLGDFFICASERQRDYWLGALTALGRVNPETYDGAELRQLIDVVPFGLPARKPEPDGPVLKGVLPGLDPGDRLVLWGGGLWEWLDPLTPVRAMRTVSARQPAARLVFFSTPRYESTLARETRQLAADLGLLGKSVLFADWLPPERWAACLLEADVGLSFHPATLETHFAFRTRLLDYIWAGLPIVTAAGDVLSARIAAKGLGYAVEPGDEAGLAEALLALLDEPDARTARQDRFRAMARQFAWERVAEPLVRYCRQPWPAADRAERARWHSAAEDRHLSELAHARRRCAELEAEAQALLAERDQAAEHAGRLASQLDDVQHRLDAAMSGRVMRFMTGTQRAWRRLRGQAP